MGTASRLSRYGVAVLAVMVALFSTMIPVIGPGMLGTLYFAVLLSAWYGGLGPGLAATGLTVAIGVLTLTVQHGANVPLRETGGFVVWIVCGVLVSLLVEALHRARCRAETNELWLSAVLTSIGDAVITTDPEGRVTFINGVAAQLTGWARDEAIGQSLEEVFVILNEETRRPATNPVRRVIETGRIQGLANHTLLVSRDGAERPIADSAAPIREKGGRVGGVVLVFRDITERRRDEIERERLNRELREDDRRKNEFLAMLSHELRNPLSAVRNAVTLASASGRREDVGWALEVVARQARHLSALIDDLLDVTRITRGMIELQRSRVEATPILRGVVQSVRPFVEQRSHTLDVALGGGGLWLDADVTRIEQVVLNLITNAAKYTDPGGRIELSAGAEGGEVVIAVRDNGIGIPPGRLEEMFELFAQGDRSLARSEGGLGVGLTIVKRLVELHGGSVAARSEGPGRGSEFTVRLPLVPPAETAGEDLAKPAAPARGPSRILVVDDNADTLRGLERLLSLLDHEVRTAENGPEAIEAAREHRPDFVLLDIGLPGMDGYEVARRLRLEESCRGVTIIAISGYGHDSDRRRSREAGFDHHLVKPVEFDALATLLARR